MMQVQLCHPMHTASGSGVLELDFSLDRGTLLAVSGPSGSGKTTLLRILAGLLRPQQGSIAFGDAVWLDTQHSKWIRPQDRQVGMVFQDYALFPNMNVYQNLAFALQKGQPRTGLDNLIQIVGLEELVYRYPHQLSGGQQQRVALARALVRQPRLLLLDEPLAALETELRMRLQDYVLQVHQHFQLTTLLVSHDYTEIAKMADRVIRLDEGRITFDGRPEQLTTLRMAMVFRRMEVRDNSRIAVFQYGEQELSMEMPGNIPLWEEGQQVWMRVEGDSIPRNNGDKFFM